MPGHFPAIQSSSGSHFSKMEKGKRRSGAPPNWPVADTRKTVFARDSWLVVTKSYEKTADEKASRSFISRGLRRFLIANDATRNAVRPSGNAIEFRRWQREGASCNWEAGSCNCVQGSGSNPPKLTIRKRVRYLYFTVLIPSRSVGNFTSPSSRGSNRKVL